MLLSFVAAYKGSVDEQFALKYTSRRSSLFAIADRTGQRCTIVLD